jgi:hypothetical protein
VLRLTASDGQLSASDDVDIALSMNNQAPFVDAGFDQTIVEAGRALGEAGDDGLPAGQPSHSRGAKPARAPSHVRQFRRRADQRHVFKIGVMCSSSRRATRLNASDFVTVTVRDACNPVAAPDGLVGFLEGRATPRSHPQDSTAPRSMASPTLRAVDPAFFVR